MEIEWRWSWELSWSLAKTVLFNMNVKYFTHTLFQIFFGFFKCLHIGPRQQYDEFQLEFSAANKSPALIASVSLVLVMM